MTRQTVTVERHGGLPPLHPLPPPSRVRVAADVCGRCGERYFDLEAMRTIEG